MPTLRPDLNGQRLVTRGSADVWFIVHGAKRRISSSQVLESLFVSTERYITSVNVEEIESGADIGERSCLVRVDRLHIYLILDLHTTGEYFHIKNWETFVDYDFNADKIVDISSIFLLPLKESEAITRADLN